MKYTHLLISFGKLGFGALCCAIGASVQAFQTNVNITSSFTFSPSSVSIGVNDSVKWTWTGNSHSTTSSTGLWDSGVHSSGFTFTNVFSSSGNFPYFCSVHTFMTGSVTVNSGANQPPSVTVTNPPSGSTFAEPWTGTLQASASDTDGSVTNVEFFMNASSLGSVSKAPYDLPVSNLGAGAYTFTAVASDNKGATKTSTAVSITVVTAVATVISDPQRLSASQFSFSYAANAGLRYVVERSATLSNFAGINTNTAGGSTVTFTDVNATGDVNFYRVRRLPNP